MVSVAGLFDFDHKPPSDPFSVDFPSSAPHPLFGGPRVSSDLLPTSWRGDLFEPEDKSTAEGSEIHVSALDSLVAVGFKPGDMIWGKVKSHPWWPGQIYNEAFALPSVLASKVDGHILVAFFGDNSYGWLDPADLLPFDPHFPEKSKQATYHSFVNAVEDAVDEVSRRGGLGLTCYCRNPSNFRPASVLGYFAVDVPGSEPGWVFSKEQIEEARESVRPTQMLSFARELAMAPLSKEPSLDWIKREAVLLAYRSALFEEFDETYAQSFGREPTRPSQDASDVSGQPDKFAIRGKDPSAKKKKRHLLGHRHELPALSHKKAPSPNCLHAAHSRRQPVAQSPTGPPATSPETARALGHPATASKHVDTLQPKAKPTPSDTAAIRSGIARRTASERMRESLDSQGKKGFVCATRSSAMNVHGKLKKVQVPRRPLEDAVSRSDTMKIKVKREVVPHEAKPENSHAEQSQLPVSEKKDHVLPDLNRLEDSAAPPPEPELGLAELISDLRALATNSFCGDDRNAVATVISVFGKFRSLLYRKSMASIPSSESDMSESGEVKIEIPPVPSETIPMPGGPADFGRKRSNSPVGAEIEISPVPSKTIGTRGRHAVIGRKPSNSPVGAEVDISTPGGSAVIGRKRSNSDRLDELPAKRIKKLEALKALSAKKKAKAFPEPSKPDQPETHRLRPATAGGSAVIGRKRSNSDRLEELPAKRIKKLEALKALSAKKAKACPEPSKPDQPETHRLRPAAAGGSAVIGRKRSMSNRLEELPAKRIKKLEALKALCAKKKAEACPKPSPPPSKPVQTAATQMLRPATPTFLVMKFPAGAVLPSLPSLKVRFGRLGHMIVAGTRVFCKNSTCKVLYKYRSDAEFAVKHAKSKSLFGQVKVKYHLRELDAPTAEQLIRLPKPTSVQPKSCLKKLGGDAGSTESKAIPRVRFSLGRGDGRAEQHETPPPPPVPPLAPLPPYCYGAMQHRGPSSPVGRRSSEAAKMEGGGGKKVDIKHELMSLLMSCSDVVSAVNTSLGYVPYHPI